MSNSLGHLVQALALIFLATLFWFAASLPYRFLGGMVDRWERDGVIRSPSSKVWKEDNPGLFTFVVNCNKAGIYGTWLALRGAAIICGLLAAGLSIAAGFSAVLGH